MRRSASVMGTSLMLAPARCPVSSRTLRARRGTGREPPPSSRPGSARWQRPRADLHARRLPDWHLRQAWAPLTYTDQEPPARPDPVAPARRSEAAETKASVQQDPQGRPYRGFRGLLAHLATLTRNQVRFDGAPADVPVLAEPTSEQRQAFDLIGAPIPLTLK